MEEPSIVPFITVVVFMGILCLVFYIVIKLLMKEDKKDKK